MEEQRKPFKIKLHPPLDQVTADRITRDTLAAINDRLYKPPALTSDDIGKEIKSEGIYLGVYEPVDRDGVSLKKVFNVFAAPEDLPKTMTYGDTVRYISKLKDWHGHDGSGYINDTEIFSALKDGLYKGGWVIPTRDILYGKDLNDKETTPDNIFALKQKDIVFKKTFKAVASKGTGCPNWYWSSTEGRDVTNRVYTKVDNVATSGDNGPLERKIYYRLSCRLVRLVPR